VADPITISGGTGTPVRDDDLAGTVRVTNGMTLPLEGSILNAPSIGTGGVTIARLPHYSTDDGTIAWGSGAARAPSIEQHFAALAAQVNALAAILRLTEEERSLVQRGLCDPSRDFFLVLADWLEERGRDEAGSRFRHLAKEAA